MTTRRILTYAFLGIIAGLLLENKTLVLGNKARKTAARVKDRLEKTGRQAKEKMSL